MTELKFTLYYLAIKHKKEIAQELKVYPSTISLLNNRPRKTLKFNTPNEVFFANFIPNKKIALGG